MQGQHSTIADRPMRWSWKQHPIRCWVDSIDGFHSATAAIVDRPLYPIASWKQHPMQSHHSKTADWPMRWSWKQHSIQGYDSTTADLHSGPWLSRHLPRLRVCLLCSCSSLLCLLSFPCLSLCLLRVYGLLFFCSLLCSLGTSGAGVVRPYA